MHNNFTLFVLFMVSPVWPLSWLWNFPVYMYMYVLTVQTGYCSALWIHKLFSASSVFFPHRSWNILLFRLEPSASLETPFIILNFCFVLAQQYSIVCVWTSVYGLTKWLLMARSSFSFFLIRWYAFHWLEWLMDPCFTKHCGIGGN